MSSHWHSYPEYQPSNLEWLEQIPEGWRTIRLKRTVKACSNGVWGDPPDGDGDVVCVRVADFDRVRHRVADDDLTIRSVAKDKRTGRLLEVGDLLLEKSGGGEKQPVGAVVRFDLDLEIPAVCSNFIARMPVASGLDSRFLNYLHTTLYAMGVNIRSIKQSIGIQNLDSDHYLMQRVPIPSLYEQRTISAFLDRETARIDRLIGKQERLIELLEEKRAALISHAVTKGLDHDVPMSDFGMPWLVAIPAHWDSLKLKHIASVEYSNVDKYSREEETPVRLCNYVDVYYNEYITADLEFMDATASPEEIESYRLRESDVIITKDSETWDDIAVPAYVPEDLDGVVCGYHLAMIRPDSDVVDGEYLFRAFSARGVNDQFRVAATGITRYGLGKHWLEGAVFPVPPLPEQRTISAFLDRETARIDALITQVRAMVDRLEEYRTALISAAVTGKIDVREEAQPA